MFKYIKEVIAYYRDYDKRLEEYKMALWRHEQIGYQIYSIEIALNKIEEEECVLKGA
jgi:hypothetical protein